MRKYFTITLDADAEKGEVVKKMKLNYEEES